MGKTSQTSLSKIIYLMWLFIWIVGWFGGLMGMTRLHLTGLNSCLFFCSLWIDIILSLSLTWSIQVPKKNLLIQQLSASGGGQSWLLSAPWFCPLQWSSLCQSRCSTSCPAHIIKLHPVLVQLFAYSYRHHQNGVGASFWRCWQRLSYDSWSSSRALGNEKACNS